ncbi:UNVERIFIED_CONTAM: hypothetical protein K2H54_070050 [Gekko kuhli]
MTRPKVPQRSKLIWAFGWILWTEHPILEDKLLEDKLQAFITLAQAKCTLKELQLLLGHLNFTCQMVTLGRAFCACMAWAMEERFHSLVLEASHYLDLFPEQLWEIGNIP